MTKMAENNTLWDCRFQYSQYKGEPFSRASNLYVYAVRVTLFVTLSV